MGNYASHQRNQLGSGITPSTSPYEAVATTDRTSTNRVPNTGRTGRVPNTDKVPNTNRDPNTGRIPTGPISSILNNRTPAASGTTKTPPTPGAPGFKDYRTAPSHPMDSFNYQKARGDPNVRNAAKLVVNTPVAPTPTGPTQAEIAAQQQQAAAAEQAAQQAAAVAAQQAQFWANHEAAKRMRGEL